MDIGETIQKHSLIALALALGVGALLYARFVAPRPAPSYFAGKVTTQDQGPGTTAVDAAYVNNALEQFRQEIRAEVEQRYREGQPLVSPYGGLTP